MNLPREEYLASLPKKHLASVVLITNEENKVLIVNPTYKDHWEIPGGIVEALETPRDGAKREVKEEIGLDLEIGRLLAVDYRLNHKNHDSLQIVFDGGVLSEEQIKMIKLPEDELSEFKFVDVSELDEYYKYHLAQRIKNAFNAKEKNLCLYLEEGKLTQSN